MNLLHLSLLSFIFISTSAFVLDANNLSRVVKQIIPSTLEAKKYSDLPVLAENSGFPIISAQSAMAVDLVSGVTLYEKDPLKPLFPASTTKIITAMVSLDEYDLSDIVEVKNVSVIGQKMGLYVGEKISVRSLLEGLLIYSANDAAEALANNHLQGRDYFVSLMNKKVKSLNLMNSSFTNPTGLDDAGQYSNVRDLIAISRVAIQNPVFSEIVATKEKTVSSIDGKREHRLKNINELLGKIEGVKGVKTGWTEVARENLVTYIEKDGRKVMIAVLGSQDRFGETKELIDWIFNNYKWTDVSYYSP